MPDFEKSNSSPLTSNASVSFSEHATSQQNGSHPHAAVQTQIVKKRRGHGPDNADRRTGRERSAESNRKRAHQEACNPGSYLSTGRKIAIKAMLDAGIKPRHICRSEGISFGTLQRIAKDDELRDILNPRIMRGVTKSMSARLWRLADHAIGNAAKQGNIDATNSYQSTLIAGIAIEKARLLDGESTQNIGLRAGLESVETELSSIAEIKKRLAIDIGADAAIENVSQPSVEISNVVRETATEHV